MSTAHEAERQYIKRESNEKQSNEKMHDGFAARIT